MSIQLRGNKMDEKERSNQQFGTSVNRDKGNQLMGTSRRDNCLLLEHFTWDPDEDFQRKVRRPIGNQLKDPDDFRKFHENVRVLLKGAGMEGEMPIDIALEKFRR